jgi:hypothetical protein
MLNYLLLFGGLAGGTLLLMQIFQNKEGIGKYLKDLFQKKKIEEIADINKQEEPVIKKIEDNELLSETTKEKIKEIKREANKQIIETLKTENFSDLAKKEDELW